MSGFVRVALIVLSAGALSSFGMKSDPIRAQGSTNTFQGTGKGTPGPVTLHAGLAIVRARSNGTSNFTVSLVTQDPGATVSSSYNNRYLMIDSVGAYNGAAGTLLKQDGSYYFDVTQASGPFQLTVEQPTPETVQPVNQAGFSGKGQQVTSYFTLAPGSYTVTATNDSTTLKVRMYALDDLGGSAVVSPSTGFYGDELMDSTIPPGSLSVPITVNALGTNPDGTPIPGVFVFYMDPEGTGPGNWTVSVQ
jgi:hypothetical protein